MNKNLILGLLLVAFGINSNGQIKLPALISDSMILQRNQRVNIWGWSLKGEPVNIYFNQMKYSAIPDKDKKWTLTLPETKASDKTYTLKITTAHDSVEVKEIVFGDVWLCSGQSNMEFDMQRITAKYPVEIANSDNKFIREFQVEKQYAYLPKTTFSGRWKRANPTNIIKFSAVSYFMAKSLYDKYKVPIGVIHTSWGGTPAEAWTSEEGLKDFSYFIEKLPTLKDSSYVSNTIKKDKAVSDAWYQQAKLSDEGSNSGNNWAAFDLNVSDWKAFNVPGYWETQGAKDVDGVVWFRKEIVLTHEMLGKNTVLEMGMLDDGDTTYINGIKVGATSNKYTIRKYIVPAGVLKEGRNVIAVRILDTDGNGGFIQDKKYRLVIGNENIELSGAWQYKVGVSVPALPINTFTRFHCQPTSLFNGMIAPLVPYTIKGAAWYQGESNSGKPEEYKKLLPAMITDWRNQWKQGDFPFLIVQLANYMDSKPTPEESNWAELRESQSLTARNVKNCGIAVTIDIGEAHDIHPLNKKTVGERLALAAENVAYQEKGIVYSGPVYESMKVLDNKIELSFSNIGSGLTANDGKELTRFAIAGADKKFVWAKATIVGDKIIVESPTITNPVAVRYAWASNPSGCNLYNKEGLPASPFRTDNWTRK